MSEFGTLDLEEMAGEGSRLSDGGQERFLDQFVPMPDVKPGQTGIIAVRVLPPVKGGKLYQYNRTHKLNTSVHCPRPLVNGKWDKNVYCPICEKYSSIWKDIDRLKKNGASDEDATVKRMKDDARKLKAIERYYYNCIVRSLLIDGKEQKNVGPRILSVGVGLHKLIIEAIVGRDGDPDSKIGNVTDPKAGWDLIIRKEVTPGDGFPKYERSGFAKNPSPAGTPEELKGWQENLHDLTKLRNPKDAEYLEKQLAVYLGIIPDENEGFDQTGFEAKWRQKVGAETNGHVSQPATGVVAETSVTETTTVTATPAKDGPMTIEDEDFLRQIEEMEKSASA